MDIDKIVEAFIALISAIITYYLIPLIKTKIEADKLDRIKEWVRIAVQSAEMMYSGSGRGDEKKEYVLQYLKGKGFKLDADTLNNLVESAVLELKNDFLEL